jgi:methylated-DNA-[protein]-cysteine S-methyltransferase
MTDTANTSNADPERSLAAVRKAAEDAAEAAARRFVQRAGEAGLTDIAYARADSPIGPLAIAATKRGLIRLAFLRDGMSEERLATDLAASVSPRVLEAPTLLDEVRRELDQYFSGDRRRFELGVDWRLVRGFGRHVLRATAAIPYGETASYAEVAAEAGNPLAYRAAGTALGRNPIPIVIPCHRVLASGGGLGGYGGGLETKRFLLGLEGAL